MKKLRNQLIAEFKFGVRIGQDFEYRKARDSKCSNPLGNSLLFGDCIKNIAILFRISGWSKVVQSI